MTLLNKKVTSFFQKLTFVLILLVIAVLILWRVSPAMSPIPGRDSGVFQYIGWKILQGGIPYQDAWDHKPPLIYFINALGLWLGGGSSWGVWTLEIVSLVSAAVLSFQFLSQFGKFIAATVTLLWLYSIPFLISEGNLTTEYGLSVQFFILFLFFRYLGLEKSSIRTLIGIGILSGLLFIFKQPLAGISVSIIIILLYRFINTPNWKQLVLEVFPILIGFLLVIGLVVLYFGVHGALRAVWMDAFYYNFFYSASDIGEKFFSILRGIIVLSPSGLSIYGLIGWFGILYIFLTRQQKHLHQYQQYIYLFLLVDLPIEYVLTSLSGRIANHYYFPWIPVHSLLTAMILQVIITKLPKAISNCNLRRLIVLLFVLVSPTYFLILGYWKLFYYHNNQSNSVLNNKGYQIVEYILTNSEHEQTVLILGAETSYNFIARRNAPTRFVYQYPLVKTGFDSREYEAEFFMDIEQNKPRIIIDATSTNLAFTTGDIGRLENTYHGQGFNQRVFATDYFKSSCKFDRKFEMWTAYLCE